MKIQIAGPGCPKCRASEAVVRKVCSELGVEAEIEHLKNPAEFAKLGVMLTPAVVIDGDLIESGHVPSEAKMRQAISQRIT
jgi:small redox-active disulfide protein 2